MQVIRFGFPDACPSRKLPWGRLSISIPRCGHTFSNALIFPSGARQMMIFSLPMLAVLKSYGSGNSDSWQTGTHALRKIRVCSLMRSPSRATVAIFSDMHGLPWSASLAFVVTSISIVQPLVSLSWHSHALGAS